MVGIESTPSGTYREQVFELFADSDCGTGTTIERAIEIGCEYLGMGVGFLTRIEDGTQTIVHSRGGVEAIQPGRECRLDWAYCRRTIETDGVRSVENARSADWISRSAYEYIGLDCYIGCKVLVGGETYGTVCFGDTDRRDHEFTEAEQLFVELLAQLFGQSIEREEYERTIETQRADIRQEKARFRNIVETSFDVILRADRDGTVTCVSPAVTDVLGYEQTAVVGERLETLAVDAASSPLVAAHGRILDGESVEGVEFDAESAGGDVVTFELNGTPVTEDGSVVVAQLIARDVTGRKARQQELRLKNRAVDTAEIGITIVDLTAPDHPIVYVNDRFQDVTGYEESAVLGRTITSFCGQATISDAVESIEAAITARESTALEFVAYRRNGTAFWNRMGLTPVESEDGTVTHCVAFHQDVTEDKRRGHLTDVLRRILRHNIRNDINVISGSLECLRTDVDADADSSIGRIDRAAGNLLETAERVRELEAHTERPRRLVRHDPEVLLAGIASEYSAAYPAATIGVSEVAPGEICAGHKLRQAVAELVENAVVHDEDESTSVWLSARRDGDEFELAVRDDGSGILPAEAAVVTFGYETDLVHNRGVGLWIANWIVTEYGGSFQIRRDDEGTIARIRVPAIGPEETTDDIDARPTTLFQ